MCVECVGFAAAAMAWTGHFYRSHIRIYWDRARARWSNA